MTWLDTILPRTDLVLVPPKDPRRGLLADLVPYDVFADDPGGIVGLKHHGWCAGWDYEGPDFTVPESERVAERAEAIERAAANLPPGCVVHWSVIRDRAESAGRARREGEGHVSEFVEACSVDRRRSSTGFRQRTRVFISMPGEGGFLDAEGAGGFERLCRAFGYHLRSAGESVRRLEGDLLFSGLGSAIRHREVDLEAPGPEMLMDQALALGTLRRDREFGEILWVDDRATAVVAVTALPGTAQAGWLENIVRGFSGETRLVHRFVATSREAALKRIRGQQWRHLMSGMDLPLVVGWLLRSSDRSVSKGREGHVFPRMDQCTEAETEVQGGKVYGLASSGAYVYGENAAEASALARELIGRLETHGVSAVLERHGVVPAYRASLPGDGTSWQRLLQMSVAGWTGLLPVGSPWKGAESLGHPDKEDLGPLVFCRSRYDEQFGFSPWGCDGLEDVGHMVIIGVPGAGKSVFLNHALQGTLRFGESRVISLDVDESQRALCLATGGEHRKLGEAGLSAAPFAELSSGTLSFSTTMVLELLHQQRVEIEASVLSAVGGALRRMLDLPRDLRTLETFAGQLGSRTLRQAVGAFFGDGPFAGYLDGTPSGEPGRSKYRVNEMRSVLGLNERIGAPIVAYLFSEMLASLNGRDIRVFAVEELHETLRRSYLAEKFDDILLNFRKQLGGVWLVAHNATEIVGGRMWEAIRAAVPTRVFLPDRAAGTDDELRKAYKAMGLSEDWIDSLATARPKKEYLVLQGSRAAWIRLNLTDLELAIFGTAGKRSARCAELHEELGSRWWIEYALERGVDRHEIEAAERWLERRTV